MEQQLAVLVPIYKSVLAPLEEYSLDVSLKALAGRKIFFIAPRGLPCSYYETRYEGIAFAFFDPQYFETIVGYNRLLLDTSFYEHFIQYEYVLILQTDAVVLRDDLDAWANRPYDYIGAPWPDGNELFINLGRFEGSFGKRLKVHVGNGGLSLRRTRKCLALLAEFSEATDTFLRTGSSEDLFFAFMGALSNDFVIPNEITASRFSLELRPSYYFHVNGGILPMGGHAWWKYDIPFWRAVLPPAPILDSLR